MDPALSPRRRPATSPGAAALLALVAACLPTAAGAQLAPLALDVRGGMSVPVGGFEGFDAAPTFGASLVTRNVHGWGVALGFAQSRFGCAGAACVGDGEYVATDMEVAGVRTFGDGRLAPWIRAGFAFGRTELDAVAGGSLERRLSDLAVGATAGAGVAVRVGGSLGLSPGLRFAWMNTQVPGQGPLRLRYLLADVGVLFNF